VSFNDLAIVITAENLASSEFAKVATDASAMGENVRASSSGFETLKTHAEATTVSLRSISMAFSSVAMAGSAIISLAGNLGLVDKESAKWAGTILTVVSVVSALIRVKSYLTLLTTGHTAAVAINTASVATGTTAQSAHAGASIATSIALGVKTAATWVATTAQNALNISHATFLALTGVGIAVIIAAAAAIWYFASQMNAAVQGFNAAAGAMPGSSRNIQRAGESDLYRRGVEGTP